MAETTKSSSGEAVQPTVSSGTLNEPIPVVASPSKTFKWEGVGDFDANELVSRVATNLDSYLDNSNLSDKMKAMVRTLVGNYIKGITNGTLSKLANGKYLDTTGTLANDGQVHEKKFLGINVGGMSSKDPAKDRRGIQNATGFAANLVSKVLNDMATEKVGKEEAAKKEEEAKLANLTDYNGMTTLLNAINKSQGGAYNTTAWFAGNPTARGRQSAVADALQNYINEDWYKTNKWDKTNFKDWNSYNIAAQAYMNALRNGDYGADTIRLGNALGMDASSLINLATDNNGSGAGTGNGTGAGGSETGVGETPIVTDDSLLPDVQVDMTGLNPQPQQPRRTQATIGNYKGLSWEDQTHLWAAGVDLASTGLGLIPGANIASAGIGAGASTAHLVADIGQGNILGGLGNAVLNYGLDALSLVPELKVAKGAKALYKIAKYVPHIAAAVAASNLISDKDEQWGIKNSLKKVIAITSGKGSFKDLSEQDFYNISNAISVAVAGKRAFAWTGKHARITHSKVTSAEKGNFAVATVKGEKYEIQLPKNVKGKAAREYVQKKALEQYHAKHPETAGKKDAEGKVTEEPKVTQLEVEIETSMPGIGANSKLTEGGVKTVVHEVPGTETTWRRRSLIEKLMGGLADANTWRNTWLSNSYGHYREKSKGEYTGIGSNHWFANSAPLVTRLWYGDNAELQRNKRWEAEENAFNAQAEKSRNSVLHADTPLTEFANRNVYEMPTLGKDVYGRPSPLYDQTLARINEIRNIMNGEYTSTHPHQYTSHMPSWLAARYKDFENGVLGMPTKAEKAAAPVEEGKKVAAEETASKAEEAKKAAEAKAEGKETKSAPKRNRKSTPKKGARKKDRRKVSKKLFGGSLEFVQSLKEGGHLIPFMQGGNYIDVTEGDIGAAHIVKNVHASAKSLTKGKKDTSKANAKDKKKTSKKKTSTAKETPKANTTPVRNVLTTGDYQTAWAQTGKQALLDKLNTFKNTYSPESIQLAKTAIADYLKAKAEIEANPGVNENDKYNANIGLQEKEQAATKAQELLNQYQLDRTSLINDVNTMQQQYGLYVLGKDGNGFMWGRDEALLQPSSDVNGYNRQWNIYTQNPGMQSLVDNKVITQRNGKTGDAIPWWEDPYAGGQTSLRTYGNTTNTAKFELDNADVIKLANEVGLQYSPLDGTYGDHVLYGLSELPEKTDELKIAEAKAVDPEVQVTPTGTTSEDLDLDNNNNNDNTTHNIDWSRISDAALKGVEIGTGLLANQMAADKRKDILPYAPDPTWKESMLEDGWSTIGRATDKVVSDLQHTGSRVANSTSDLDKDMAARLEYDKTAADKRMTGNAQLSELYEKSKDATITASNENRKEGVDKANLRQQYALATKAANNEIDASKIMADANQVIIPAIAETRTNIKSNNNAVKNLQTQQALTDLANTYQDLRDKLTSTYEDDKNNWLTNTYKILNPNATDTLKTAAWDAYYKTTDNYKNLVALQRKYAADQNAIYQKFAKSSIFREGGRMSKLFKPANSTQSFKSGGSLSAEEKKQLELIKAFNKSVLDFLKQANTNIQKSQDRTAKQLEQSGSHATDLRLKGLGFK